MVWRFVITAAVVILILWACSALTGCAGSTVSAKLSEEHDFKSPNPVIPKVEAAWGYTF